MDKRYLMKMQGVNVVTAKELPEQIRDMLTGKGLTMSQAKLVLEKVKELLEDAVI